MVIDLSSVSNEELKAELLRREQLESYSVKIRAILKKLSDSEIAFLEQSIKEDPVWVRCECDRMMAIIYDP